MDLVVSASVNYQSADVMRSLFSTGNIFVNRATTGSDSLPVGLNTVPVKVDIYNGRLLSSSISLDKNGFIMVPHVYPHVDYYDESQILSKYYPECCKLVQSITGAREVFAFDHNIRSSGKNSWLNQNSDPKSVVKDIKGGSEVQAPAAIVHNDYTITSAPLRLQLLGDTPKVNDVLRKVLGETPLLDSSTLDRIMKGRYMFINVWRSIADTPVRDMPLALCDAQTFSSDDLITFEIRYADRIGENYFATHTESHRWVYYPEMVKDEAILLKVWDSHGSIATGHGQQPVSPDGSTTDSRPSTFSFHSAFKDDTAPADCPGRESIEVRLIAAL